MLLEKMRNRMVAHNLAKSTINGYVHGTKQLVLFCNKPFSFIESDDIYAFLVYLKEERGLSRDTMRIAACGIKYLFKYLLKRVDIVSDIPYPKKEKYLPEILNSDELKRLFDSTRNNKHLLSLNLFILQVLGAVKHATCLLPILTVKTCRLRYGREKERKAGILFYLMMH